MDKVIYVDHSATTPVSLEVLNEMLPYFEKNYGNASSIYSVGRISRAAIDNSRQKVADALNAKVQEIYFTAGGSESNNMIITGIMNANKQKGNHMITTKIEHLAILNTCKYLESIGFEVTYLDVNSEGLININELQKAIRPTTVLVSIMAANNEVGVIQPLEEIGKITSFKNIYFHTDAVQAIGNIDIDVKKLNIDALSLSGHKFYGPKGVGAAYIKENIKFNPVIYGGHQENSKRAGTENVPGIVGLGKAIEIAKRDIDENNKKLLELREYCISKLEENIPGVVINGHRTKRLPGNVNFSIPNFNGESMLLMLDMDNICASSGSACTAGSIEPSHVLKALNIDKKYSTSALRFSLGIKNTKQEIDYIIESLKKIYNKLKK